MILSIGNNCEYLACTSAVWPGTRHCGCSTTGGKRACRVPRVFYPQRLDGEGSPPRFQDSPFTAADEKIALSMVQVNSKPQYLVFCLHSRQLAAKYSHNACGKLKRPFQARFLAGRLCPKMSANRSLRSGTRPNTSVVLTATGNKAQKQCKMVLGLCEMWRSRPLLSGQPWPAEFAG